MRLMLIVAILFTLVACDDGRWAPGYLITDEGETLSNTAENKRALTIKTMVSQLDKSLAPHWRSEIAITELPTYDRDGANDQSGWLWPTATVAITLLGDGSVESPVSEQEIAKAVSDYLYRQVERPSRNLHINTAKVVDAARFAAKPIKTAAHTSDEIVEKPAVAAAPAQRRYVVQANDTWADLSLAFYGSAQHWRVIADANQGGELTVGREVVIPAKP